MILNAPTEATDAEVREFMLHAHVAAQAEHERTVDLILRSQVQHSSGSPDRTPAGDQEVGADGSSEAPPSQEDGPLLEDTYVDAASMAAAAAEGDGAGTTSTAGPDDAQAQGAASGVAPTSAPFTSRGQQ